MYPLLVANISRAASITPSSVENLSSRRANSLVWMKLNSPRATIRRPKGWYRAKSGMLMEEILIQFTFGLPAILLALLLSLAGLIAKKPLLLVLGGLFSIGPAYYLGGGLRLPVLIVPVLLFGAAFAVYKKKTRWLWLVLIPLGLAALYMTFLYIYVLLQGGAT